MPPRLRLPSLAADTSLSVGSWCLITSNLLSPTTLSIYQSSQPIQCLNLIRC